jgi:hypothetical protein
MNFSLQLAAGDFSAKFLQHLLRTPRGAATVVVRLMVGADENVVTKRQHSVLL